MNIAYLVRTFPPIRTDEDFSALENCGSAQSLEEVQDLRRQKVLDVLEE
jgi:hypothetical protein